MTGSARVRFTPIAMVALALAALRRRAVLVATCLAFAVIGCGQEPQLVSPASQSGFAETYATDLDTLVDDITEGESRAKKMIGEMPSYPEQVKGAPLDKMLRIVDVADADGRSRTYVERFRQVEAAYAFYSASQDSIAKKYADAAKTRSDDPKSPSSQGTGSSSPPRDRSKRGMKLDGELASSSNAQKSGEAQKPVDAKQDDGSEAAALGRAVEEQLKTALRDKSEAQRLVERYRTTLGDGNIAALQKQADAVSYASYLVYVGLVEDKVRLRTLLGEAQEVKKTAQDFIASEHAYQGESGRSDADKKASDARIDVMTKSAAKIDPAVEKASVVERGIDQQVQALQQEYAQSLAALRTKLGAPPPGAPAPAAASTSAASTPPASSSSAPSATPPATAPGTVSPTHDKAP